MATFNFAQNGYDGEVLEDLLSYTAQGNDTYKHGLIHVHTGIQHKYTIPQIQLGTIVQDNAATPTAPANKNGISADSLGTYTFTERFLEPKDFMIYLEFNPRDYEKYWKFAQPEGPLVFRNLDPRLQAKMLRLLIENKNTYIGDAIWLSAKTATAAKINKPESQTVIGGNDSFGPLKYFDGAMARLVFNVAAAAGSDEALGGKVTLAGSTALSGGAQVETALYTMWQQCPKQIRNNPNLRFITSWDVWDAYDKYVTSKDFKYSDNTKVNDYRFKGKEIIPIVGLPENTIILGVFSKGTDSNLWMGIDYANDENIVKIDRLQNNSELYFFQMRLKMDVNIVRPKEIVLWTNYTYTPGA